LAAEEVIKNNYIWHLSRHDSKAFVDAILHHQDPNEVLKVAAERYSAAQPTRITAESAPL
jgi:uncharacterized protein (DUF1778 family)